MGKIIHRRRVNTKQPTHLMSRYMIKHGFIRSHAERIKNELHAVGASAVDLMLAESRSLPFVIHADEHIKGVVYGRSAEGIVALVATDRRVILLDKKFLFIKYEEITYDVVSGVSCGFAGLYGTVTLHTRIGDFKLKTFNQRCALRFVDYIEERRLDRKPERDDSNETTLPIN